MEGNWMRNDQIRHERAPDDEMFRQLGRPNVDECGVRRVTPASVVNKFSDRLFSVRALRTNWVNAGLFPLEFTFFAYQAANRRNQGV